MENCNNTLALEYCNMAIDRYPDEPATQECRRIKSTILAKALEINIEQATQANKPFRFFVKYKNINTLYFRFVPIHPDSLEQLIDTYDPGTKEIIRARWDRLLALEPEGTTTCTLPIPADYRWQSTEWYYKGLKPRHYVMLVSAREDFSADSNVVQYSSFWSTEYTITGTSAGNNRHIFFLTGIDDGRPVKGATLKFYTPNYGAGGEKLIAEKTTDAKGMAEIETADNYWSVTVKAIVKGKEVLNFRRATSLYSSYYREDNIGIASKIYTDRGIYRPGQTLYYKGIVYTSRARAADSKVMPNYKTTVVLADANGQEVARQEVQTNRYGSYSGSFTIPHRGLTGYFTIADDRSSFYIQVEEYKRPKFRVEFDTLKTTPAFNDSVTVTGKAVAYAGNAIGNAAVQYEITRYTPWLGFMKWGTPAWENQNITLQTGTLQTGANGTFSIKFKAVPGEDTDRTYNYEVKAYVTDISGETQEGGTSVTIGTRTVFSDFLMPETVIPPQPQKIVISANNLSQNPVPVKGRFVIYQMEMPGKLLRQRRWGMPDTQVISRKQFEKLFPNDAYNESSVSDNKVIKTVFEKTIDNKEGRETIEWQTKGLSSGLYKAVFEYAESNGRIYTHEQVFSVLNPAKKQPIGHDALQIANLAGPGGYRPGQSAEVLISSRAKKSHVFYFIERNGKPLEISETVIKNGVHKLKIPVTEEDRGGIIITAFTIYNNRYYKAEHTISVPWDNRHLTVEVTSYRDEMLPGSSEEWTLRIKGPGAQKISAEVLASMYDASLDRFASNEWSNFITLPSLFSRLSVSPFYMGNIYGQDIFSYPVGDYSFYSFPPVHIRWFNWLYDPLSPAMQWNFGDGNGGGRFSRYANVMVQQKNGFCRCCRSRFGSFCPHRQLCQPKTNGNSRRQYASGCNKSAEQYGRNSLFLPSP